MSGMPGLVLRPEWTRGEIAVVGLARSGRAAALLLARAGCRVYASDLGRSAELDETGRTLER
jgi:UDP-N-acetylmuramoylalanine-D-glutamate ligase